MYSGDPTIQAGRTLPLMAGIDGVRALAVIAVVLYHLEVSWLPAGFLGVDVFFVVSGFLITSLLVADIRRQGRFNVRRFWVRRARRLLPALVLLLVGVVTYTAVMMPGELRAMRGDVAAAFGYVTNWALIYDHASYFESMDRPSLLRHLWSLAVEEQFYVLWPLIVAGGWALLRRRMLSLVWLGALGSVVLMAALYDPLTDPSRVYFGTDTRAVGLLIGAGLAFIADPVRLVRPLTGRGRALAEVAAWGGLAGLAAWMALGSEYEMAMYRGGFLVVSLASAALMVGAATSTTAARLLRTPVLGWIGQRSYGIYLWHWPVLMVTRPQLDVSLTGWRLDVMRVAITVAIAATSYRLVELPIIDRGLAGWMRGMLRPRPRPARALAGVGGLAVATAFVATLVLAPPAIDGGASAIAGPPDAIAIAATTATVPAAPEPLVRRLPDDAADRRPSVATAPANLPLAAAGTQRVDLGGIATTVGTAPRPSPPPLPATITAIGDSVMLGAAADLLDTLGDATTVDAVVSRSFADGAALIAGMAREGTLGDLVVVHLGTNGPVDGELFDTLMAGAQPAQRVLAVTVRVPRRWEDQVNGTLLDARQRWPQLEIVDWHGLADDQPELFVGDGIHLTAEGRQVYAAMVERTIAAGDTCAQRGDCQPVSAL